MFFGSCSFPLFLLLHAVFLFLCVCFVPAISCDHPHPFRVHGDQVHCGGLCVHVVIDWFDCSEFILLSPCVCVCVCVLRPQPLILWLSQEEPLNFVNLVIFGLSIDGWQKIGILIWFIGSFSDWIKSRGSQKVKCAILAPLVAPKWNYKNN